MQSGQYKIVSQPKTLQELFSTPGIIIQLGSKEYTSIHVRTTNRFYYVAQKHLTPNAKFFEEYANDSTIQEHDILIPIHPNYFRVYENFKVESETEVLQFNQGKNGLLSLGNTKERIVIQNNLIWLYEGGIPCKKYYYAMTDLVIMDAQSYNPIIFLSEVEII